MDTWNGLDDSIVADDVMASKGRLTQGICAIASQVDVQFCSDSNTVLLSDWQCFDR